MDERSRASVTITRRFQEPAERIFDAWLDPAVARRWLFATPSGLIVDCRIEPRVGGGFTIVDRRDGEDVAHTGEYLEIDRPSRLVFSFAVPKYSSAISRVGVDIAPVAGGCVLTLTNDGVPAEYADGARQGWTDLMVRLEKTLAG
jgi:uncharacterized protein YndB with AHSA1/START domain